MSFSTTPITAAGSATDYTHKFKKHFGDRPTAFALSEYHSRPSSSTSFASSSSHQSSSNVAPSSSYGAVLDPFAASSSYSTHSAQGSAPTSHEALNSASTTSTFSSTAPTLGPGKVDIDTHTALANLGWRIRSRVNQGYSRTTTSLDPFNTELGQSGSAFRSERDVLSNVTNTRRGWSRVSTAPTVAGDFQGLRKAQFGVDCMDTEMDVTTNSLTYVAPKRTRDDSDSDGDQEQDTDAGSNAIMTQSMEGEERRINGMPKLSFSSSTSSTTSSIFSTSPATNLALPSTTRGFSRHQSSAVSPFTHSAPTQVAKDEEMDFDCVPSNLGLGKTEGATESYDFSSHFNCTDF